MSKQEIMQQIEALETSAGTAGDLLQAAICQIALYGEPNEATEAALSPEQRVMLCTTYGDPNGDDNSWLRSRAEQVCLDVIRANQLTGN